jgi:hypothetical protein
MSYTAYNNNIENMRTPLADLTTVRQERDGCVPTYYVQNGARIYVYVQIE